MRFGKLGTLGLISIITIILMVIVDGVAWYKYKGELEATKKPRSIFDYSFEPTLDKDLLHDVGFFSKDSRRGFDTNNIPPKQKGWIRIGAFGDSFTYGDEVDSGFDFPSLLRRRLDKIGLKNVEVFNLGSSWYGFHQAFRLYDKLSEKLDLDYVLLGPLCFQTERNQTFNHGGLGSPYYIHGRYILDESQNNIEFVSPGGRKDFVDRFNSYFSWIPGLNVARYDRTAPPFLQALVSRGSVLPNPFYYSKLDEIAEDQKIVGKMFERFAKETKGTVLIHPVPWVLEAAAPHEGKISSTRFFPVFRFPYFMVGHFSPMGNDFVSRLFLGALTGASRMSWKEIFFEACRERCDGPKRLSLAEVDSFKVIVGEEVLGTLIVTQKPETGTIEIARPQKLGAKSLFGIVNSKISPIDTLYLPLHEEMREGDEVTMKISSKEGTQIQSFPVKFLNPSLPFAVAEIEGFSKELLTSLAPIYAFIPEGRFKDTAVQSLELSYKNRTLYKSQWSNDGKKKFLFGPADEVRQVQFKPFRNKLLDVDSMPAQGKLWLEAQFPNAPPTRYHFLDWKLEARSYDLGGMLQSKVLLR